jgi:beta-ribofuranosylaminobenzene 5'-phosphate synthase
MESSAFAAGGVRVEAPARLQMGLVDLRGDLGRLFGGLGAAVEEPRTVLEVQPDEELAASGPDGERAAEFAQRFLAHVGLDAGARIRVLRTIPAHVGLGSGTQLALAVSLALATLHDLPADMRSLVAAVGRGARSAVGSWTFERGGLVVDGGRRMPASGPGLAPLLARYPMPAAWRCVLAIPALGGGLSGEEERSAFERLPAPPAAVVGRIAHLVLMGVLPAVVERDLAAFGAAVAELQRLVGECFAPVQGSTYASPEVADLVRRASDLGAVGVGQSSWGPTVYGFVEGEERAAEIAGRLAEALGPDGSARATALDNRGARLTRLQGVRTCPEGV